MKGFSNQLIEKHRYVKLLEKSGCSDQDVERAKHEFDSLISCKQFLDVAGLESSIAAVSYFLPFFVCWYVVEHSAVCCILKGQYST